MKSKITLILLILFYQISANNDTNNCTKQSSEVRTFMVKTKLTKEELEELIIKNENLKGKDNQNLKLENKVQQLNNTDTQLKAALEREIEEENEKEALTPMEEFIVKEMKNQNNIKAFISKTKAENINSFYEKKYGRIYAYLTLFSVIFLIIYFRGIIFKGKENIKKRNYNIFDSDSNEYMLVKSE